MKIILVLISNFVLSFVITMNNQFTPYVKEVFRQAQINNAKIEDFNTLSIQFSPNIATLGFSGVAPACFEKDRLILINPFVWYSIKDTERLVLIAHEMGHAIWHRRHLPDSRQSLMIGRVMTYINTAVFIKNEKRLWKEFFNPKAKKLEYFKQIMYFNNGGK